MPSKIRKLERVVGKLPSIPRELLARFVIGPVTQEAVNAARLAFK